MKASVTCAALLVQLAVATATAGIVATISDQGPAPSLPGYTAYVLNLTEETPDYRVIAVELDLLGPMHQFTYVDPATEEVARIIASPLTFRSGLPTPVVSDTHLLFNLAEVNAQGLLETGSRLYGAIAIRGGATSPMSRQSLDVAQVVLPDGAAATFSVRAIAAHPSAPSTFVDSRTTGIVPEPASLSLTLVGAVGMLLRRRGQ